VGFHHLSPTTQSKTLSHAFPPNHVSPSTCFILCLGHLSSLFSLLSSFLSSTCFILCLDHLSLPFVLVLCIAILSWSFLFSLTYWSFVSVFFSFLLSLICNTIIGIQYVRL
jgi:hypothetical protein